MKIDTDGLMKEIHRAENALEEYSDYYHAREKDTPESFKFLMYLNGWQSPFEAINELLKRIDTNEMLLKRYQKETGKKLAYKSRYKELRQLVQKKVNEHEQRKNSF
jgi:hypothetical protein